MTEPTKPDPASPVVPTAGAGAAKPGGKSKVIIVAVAAVLGALAFSIFTGNKDDKVKTGAATTTSAAPGQAVSSTTVSAGATPGVQPGEVQLVTVTGSVLPNLTDDGADKALNAKAPALTGFAFDGQPVSIDPADGKAKVIMFVAHWCPHCQREVPLIAQWQKEGKLPTDLAYYTVSTAVQTKGPNFPPSAWLAADKWPFPVLVDDKDSTAVKSYGFGGFPFFAVLRADGTIAARASGEMELDAFVALLNKAKVG
jgi:cytochrome c biogenesis protein CcmG, thiol:disulfide interchange protein DsbE